MGAGQLWLACGFLSGLVAGYLLGLQQRQSSRAEPEEPLPKRRRPAQRWRNERRDDL